ncbi:glycosyltransferase family 39 protein [bacterium]|nr:glycosyltransferase family 39 protein [bacterium]
MEKVLDFVKKHSEIFTILGLIIFCYFVFFFNIGNYALMDVDETRYVSMARDMFNTKDFMTLYLNGEYFFEKPPLYFWGECLSFALFGHVSEFSARFPVALYGSLCTFLMYFVGKKVVSRRYGLISAVILATTMEFVMLAKFAILDIVVTTCIGFSVMFGFLTQFVKEKNVKYFWWLFYIFSGLAVMAKGIPGFVVPFGTMFFVTIFNKSFKKIFKPQYFIVGSLLFLLIVLPWHIAMFKIHDPLFFNEYIMKHHINRFFSSSEIHRKQPFYFYFLTILWGMFPYVLSVLAVGITKIKGWITSGFCPRNDIKYKFLWFNVIGFLFTMLFFSSSSTKLITYILPVYFFTSFIIAYIWEDYIFNAKYKKEINLTVYILGGIFVLASIVGCFMGLFLPEKIYADVKIIQWFCVAVTGLFGISSIFLAKKEKFKGVFISYALLILVLSAFGTKLFYNMDYSFGQNDLMEFAKYCKDNNSKVAVINGGRKYSVLYYYGDKVNYVTVDTDEETISDDEKILLNPEIKTIIRNKDIENMSQRFDFDTLKEGKKYKLVTIKSFKI